MERTEARVDLELYESKSRALCGSDTAYQVTKSYFLQGAVRHNKSRRGDFVEITTENKNVGAVVYFTLLVCFQAFCIAALSIFIRRFRR